MWWWRWWSDLVIAPVVYFHDGESSSDYAKRKQEMAEDERRWPNKQWPRTSGGGRGEWRDDEEASMVDVDDKIIFNIINYGWLTAGACANRHAVKKWADGSCNDSTAKNKC